MGTMNYSKYYENRKQFVFDMVFPNTYAKIIKLLEAMNAYAGVKPELECASIPVTPTASWPLLDMGVLKKPLQFSFIVNVLGGIPPLRRELAAADEDHASRQRMGGHRDLEERLADDRRRARARGQYPRGPRG